MANPEKARRASLATTVLSHLDHIAVAMPLPKRTPPVLQARETRDGRRLSH